MAAPPGRSVPDEIGPAPAPGGGRNQAIDSRERYSRQVLFAPIGERGQQRLAESHAAVVGVGATGAATSGLLARAGVGTLTLIDRDFVEPSNLQRQVLFDEDDAREALPKAEAARRHLHRVNSEVNIRAHVADLTPENAADLLAEADVILDCTDNFETRYLLNDLCVRDGRPWIYAAAVGSYAATMNILPKHEGSGPRVQGSANEHEGSGPRVQGSANERPHLKQSSTAAHHHSLPQQLHAPAEPWALSPEPCLSEPWTLNPEPCLHAPAVPCALSPKPCLSEPWALNPEPCLPTACLACIFPSSPSGNVETCDTAGILSTAVNLAASLQVTEALKLLTGQPHRMRRTLLAYDLWTGERSEVAAGDPRPDCEVCGRRIFHALSGEGRPHITLCGRNSVQIHEHHRPVDLAALARRLQPLGEVRANGMLLRFHQPPHTITVFPDGRALVQGTTDIGRARSLYARYIGA